MSCIFLALAAPHCPAELTPSGAIDINNKTGTVIENVHITSATGPCLSIADSTGIVIRNSEIGPCNGGGIKIAGGSGIRILDNYIHPEFTGTGCCDSGDGIFDEGTADILIQGNVVAYGESNVEVINSSTVSVIGNFLVNPRNFGSSRGSNIQVLSGSSSVLIENNYAVASMDTSTYALAANQSDSISSSGRVNGINVRNNYISGGIWAYGCGLIVESGANDVQFVNNTMVDTGQCGIGVEGGTNVVVEGNRILNRTPVFGGGNTAIIVFKLYPTDPPCGPVSITNNIAYEIQPSGYLSAFWNGDGCARVVSTGNAWDEAAYDALTPVSQKLPPPMIPPQPYNCVAASPFSTQTSASSCNDPAAPPGNPAGRPGVRGNLSGPVSDNFNGATLNTSLWTFVNQGGNGSYTLTGKTLDLSTPARSRREPDSGAMNNTARVMQPAGSSAFGLEVKFDSIPYLQDQIEGILVEQDEDNNLHFHIASTGSGLVIGASQRTSSAESNRLESTVSIPGGAQSIWLRVQKFGFTWTETWSVDGSTFNTIGSFTQPMTLADIGVFAGSYGDTAGPVTGFIASIDYFFNMAARSPR